MYLCCVLWCEGCAIPFMASAFLQMRHVRSPLSNASARNCFLASFIQEHLSTGSCNEVSKSSNAAGTLDAICKLASTNHHPTHPLSLSLADLPLRSSSWHLSRYCHHRHHCRPHQNYPRSLSARARPLSKPLRPRPSHLVLQRIC